MESLVIFVHVIAAIGITGLVLIQHGKGADMGASFGSGASQTIFGSVGSANALTKSTSWLATIFFVTSLVLALFAKQQSGQSIADEGLIQNTEVLTEAPAAVGQDVPMVESAASDIPQAVTADEAVQEADPAPASAESVDTAEQESAIPAATAEPAEETPAETDDAPAQ